MINLVLFGKPGAGKGTQAEFLKSKYELFHISTGDLFRHHITNATDLGKLAKSYMDQGDLVPDQVTIDMLKVAVESNPEVKGFIFDGFPRTTKQAIALDEFLTEKSCVHCGEAEHVCLKFWPYDAEIRKVSKRVGTSITSRQEVFHLIDQSVILCSNCYIKKHHDLIEFI